MSKKPQSKEHLSPVNAETYRRRPIHKRSEDVRKETDEGSEKTQRIYPKLKEIPGYEYDEDESGLSDDEKSHDASFESEKDHHGSSSKENIFNRIFSNYLSILLIIMLCVFIMLFLKYVNYNKKSETEVTASKLVDIAKLISGIQLHFKKQHELTYRILKTELKKVVDLTHEPPAPAIFTVIASRGAEITASEFSQHLAHELAPKRYLLINDTTYWHDEPDSIMYKIDKKIRTFPQDDHLNVIIVDKVENIPAKAAMIFHSFCDHEAAPYKRAVFLFIVASNEAISDDADSKYFDKIAMKRFRDIWKQATDDLIDSLITRITVSVLSVR